MKQNYKAFAPDISTGGTTIKDVGKQRFSRKSSNLSKLWRLLICLMAIVMPVGAWAEGDGKSTDTPWSGNIENVEITQAGHYYLAGTINGQIWIETTGNVTLHIAGENKLHGTHITGIGETGSWPAIGTRNLSNLTIEYWDKDHKNTPSYLYLEAGNSATNKEGLRLEGNCNLTITGPVAVVAQSGTGAQPNSPAVNMNNAIVTLKDGAYFSYNNADKPTHPNNWQIENFASAGDEALRQIGTKLGTNAPMQINVDFSQFTPSELYDDYVHGEIGTQKFITKATSDKFTLLVPSSNMNYYGELAMGDNKLPFALRNNNKVQIPTVHAGAVGNGPTYVDQISNIQNGSYTLNVSQYPHSGKLAASAGEIKITGDNTHRTMHTATPGGLELDGTPNTITLEGIEIPARHSIKVKGKVLLGNDGYNQCKLTDAAKFGDSNEEVYYCIINYLNTAFANDNENEANIKISKQDGTTDYPQVLDTKNKIIYAWLPTGKFTISDGTNNRDIETTTGHYQRLFAADPVICIDRSQKPEGTIVMYHTLSEAFKDVKENEVIYLKGNYNTVDGTPARPDDKNIAAGKTFTLNLNRHTLGISSHTDPETGKLPLISSGLGTLEIKNENIPNTNSGSTGTITGNYRIEGIVYSELSLTAHIEGIEVENKQSDPKMSKQNGDMPVVITYDINGAPVNATRLTTDKYCLWIPKTSEAIGPVRDAQTDGTIFAQIKKDDQGNSLFIPLFDLNSYSISVDAQSGVTYGPDGNKYVAADFGNSTDPAEIVTVAEDNYNTENTLTVNGDAYVILKDIYKGLQTGDGKVGDKAIATKLEVTSGNADIKTSGINSIGTITIANQSTLTFNQLEETPATANALRFATINTDATATGTLNVEGGSLLAYLNDKKADQINVATATYTGGSVRAKFEKNTNRFKKENNTIALYRTSFKVNEYYTPYEYNILDNTGNNTLSGKTTSDKNGEIHLWLPHEKLGGTAKFRSSNLAVAEEEIVYSAVAEKDNNIAPASIGLYPGSTIDVDNKIGSFNSLADAFNAMTTNQEYTVVLYTAHTESNTTCTPVGSKVTIDLNGMTLNCHNVTFETTADNFMLIANNAASTNPDDEKHATISGDITVSQNVYISKNVHMEGIHVDMINPKEKEPQYKNVRRLLVKGLVNETKYTYEFAEQSIPFTVGQTLLEGNVTTGVACLWLVESMYPQEFVVYGEEENAKNGLTVPGGELAIVAHSNGYTQLQPGGVVAEVNGNKYRTLSKAIEAANDPDTNSDIKLLADIQSQATFNITQSYAIDLNGHDLTFTQGGFNATGKLTIKDGSNGTDKKGILAGVIKLISKENVSVDPSVTIGGVVVDASQATPVNIYRLMVDGDVDLNTWVETPERDTDKQYDNGNGTTYEYTIPAGLANHSTTVKGYKVVTVGPYTDFDAVNNCNVIVPENITWNATGTGYIHRLTIKAGGMVNAGDGTKITATDGIRYVRTFEADKWSLIALPFTATDITKKEGDKVVSISPAADPGTSGHFWLHTIKNDGSTTDVTDSEMTANKVYVMKTPTKMEITFVSGPNQMLRRDKVLAPDPISGFVAYANGTLNEVPVGKLCYMLDAKGENFERTTDVNAKVSPFSGYLLADAATTQNVARFSLRSTPTANEEIEIAEDELQIRTEAGRIILTTETPVQVVICDLKGTVKFSGEIPAGDSSYEVGAGIYIINNQKVIVK